MWIYTGKHSLSTYLLYLILTESRPFFPPSPWQWLCLPHTLLRRRAGNEVSQPAQESIFSWRLTLCNKYSRYAESMHSSANTQHIHIHMCGRTVTRAYIQHVITYSQSHSELGMTEISCMKASPVCRACGGLEEAAQYNTPLMWGCESVCKPRYQYAGTSLCGGVYSWLLLKNKIKRGSLCVETDDTAPLLVKCPLHTRHSDTLQ